MLQIRNLLILLCFTVLAGCAGQTRSDETRTVLVAGATGGTGTFVVAQLHDAGFEVRALVRDVEKAQDILGPDIELVAGDVRDPDSISRAMDGVDAVVSTIGGSGKNDPNGPEQVDYLGVKHLADAAANAKLNQFVLVSSRSVTNKNHPLNKMFNNLLNWKLKGEDALRNSGVPYTIIRPGGLINAPAGEKAIIFEQGDNPGGTTIARADVAAICVAALQAPAAKFKTFETTSLDGTFTPDWPAMFAALQPDP